VRALAVVFLVLVTGCGVSPELRAAIDQQASVATAHRERVARLASFLRERPAGLTAAEVAAAGKDADAMEVSARANEATWGSIAKAIK